MQFDWLAIGSFEKKEIIDCFITRRCRCASKKDVTWAFAR